MRLNDIWVVEGINGSKIEMQDETKGLERPRFEFQLSEMRVTGTDGCNNFMGPIKSVGENTIEIGTLAGTYKMCMNMEIANRFNTAFVKVRAFEIENLTLILFGANGEELLKLRKVD